MQESMFNNMSSFFSKENIIPNSQLLLSLKIFNQNVLFRIWKTEQILTQKGIGLINFQILRRFDLNY